MSAIRTLIPILPGLVACHAYSPEPLPAWSSVAAPVASTDDVTLSTAVRSMLAHNERIRASLGALDAARAEAAVPAPLANPELSLGPAFLSGANVLSRSHQAFEAALGWVLPLSGVRGATDERNAAAARAARVAAVVTAREEYLGLRRDVLALSVQVERAQRKRQQADFLTQIAARQRALGAAGPGALDLHVIELEVHAAESAAGSAEAQVAVEQGVIARRCGMTPGEVGQLPGTVAPEFPDVPDLAAVESLLGEHPDLEHLRAGYEVAEKDLQREVRKQYPDVTFGAGYEREEGVNKLVLPLGITLPLFDRNQGGIAVAGARRRALHGAFAARVRALRGEVAAAHDNLVRQAARHRRLHERIEALVARVRSDTERLLGAGRLDATRHVEVMIRVLAAQEAELDARAALYRAWTDLEKACGAPLLRLPGEPAAGAVEEVK